MSCRSVSSWEGMTIRIGIAALVMGLAAAVATAAEDRFAPAREALLNEIAGDALRTAFSTGRQRFKPAVMAAMERVPRHRFVPPAAVAQAYENRPLGIGYGQTISQPYIVALMTDLIDVDEGDVVLEVGTGSGYQAAVLAEVGVVVYTMEIIEPLAEQAGARLKALGYDTVTTRVGDGYHGWPEHAPFDAIVVTAAAGAIPPPLIRQLKPGGRMVIPVGAPFLPQELLLVTKSADGKVRTEHVLPVRFVPLTGEH